ncbi:MAG: hypothetical protein LBS75_02190 [Synergistaceae bacterium]|jgi:hypothetical protein|nr:hypothetical protein [Synergistaceae bacterium]
MDWTKKRVCGFAAVMAVLTIFAAACPSACLGTFLGSGSSSDMPQEGQNKFYDAAAGYAIARHPRIEEIHEVMKSPRGLLSRIERRMDREAAVTPRSARRNALRAYLAEHDRSITAGGKNSIISSANILKSWRDALRPLYHA